MLCAVLIVVAMDAAPEECLTEYHEALVGTWQGAGEWMSVGKTGEKFAGTETHRRVDGGFEGVVDGRRGWRVERTAEGFAYVDSPMVYESPAPITVDFCEVSDDGAELNLILRYEGRSRLDGQEVEFQEASFLRVGERGKKEHLVHSVRPHGSDDAFRPIMSMWRSAAR